MSTGLAQVLVAVLYALTARASNPAGFGYVVAAIGLGMTVVGFIDFGTNSLWVRELATHRLDREALGTRLAGKLTAAFCLTAAWIGLTLVFVPNTSSWMAGPVAFATLLNQSLQVPLRAIGRGELVALSVLVDRVAASILFGVLWLFGVAPASSLWLCLTFGSVAAALNGWLMTPVERRPRFRVRLRSNPWKSAGHFGLATTAISAQTLDTPIMTLFGGPISAGIYGAVSRWTQPMSLLASAFSSAAAPHMARAESGREAWLALRRSVWLIALAVLVCAGMVLCAPLVIGLILGPEYSKSVLVLQILAITAMFAVVNQPLFIFLQSRHFERAASYITMASVFVQLGLTAALSGWLGAVGAGIASLASQILIFVGMALVLISSRKDSLAEEELLIRP